ncbi:hypothetical protein B0I35DRAFT_350518 [Stachybotrys elegans]|uniref:U1-type domain-containing protein n=1 Tax=Stachybotrys elegans TaxID=80388 RepID=A0A8K0T0D7_9HYPO|nr:hypothetical protein B0I35DRAFT_350518 [Stachybotrys elegans]
MSEHWKSTPKYWCKHCACYVRDTKLERQNHEATAKHQGALKRFLRDLHRGHEREERDKERAKQEIARLNGVVAGSSSAASVSSSQHAGPSTKPSLATEAQLKKQREQLAELGVAMPSAFRPEMAMPGEWTVTSTRVIDPAGQEKVGETAEMRATGIRKREVTEEEKEQEAAVQGLFKKPRRWGRDSKALPHDEDKELDALLSGTLSSPKPKTEQPAVKSEDDATATGAGEVKKEEDDEANEYAIKQEAEAAAKQELEATIKQEPDEAIHAASTVVFKKRKPKGIRQR